MSISSVNATAGFEIIPGYVLQRKIGSGGYGEVWLADAPGGLRKAIKLVYGTMSEVHALNELRSLRRILSVNHPFLLSLERIEVVDGQLIVITELADGSLLDRFNEYKSKNELGIPRDRLLHYLRDAAEALDFLCQRHDLQHLDIKPGNLLLLADRVKVADFGLVKDIHNHSLSMVSGLTPTYASPELFDGRPGRYSDQYSLAIVYHELLTGQLPFVGKTAAQIASEHLHKAPNLEALSPSDRPIIQKALAKKPSQRYSSCLEFVDSLIRAGMAVEQAIGTNTENRARFSRSYSGDSPAFSSDSENNFANQDPSAAPKTICISDNEVEFLSPLGREAKWDDCPSPVLFIGLGKTGGEVLTLLRSKLSGLGLNLEQQFQYDWLFFDTDVDTTAQMTDDTTAGRLPRSSCVSLPIRTADEYRKVTDDRFSPLSRRWLFNVPRSEKTEGIRPIGMLAFLDHARDCMDIIDERICEFKARFTRQQLGNSCRIYLVASAHGGTGSTLINEIAFLLHEALDKHTLGSTIQLVMTLGKERDPDEESVEAASARACLTEIAHYMGNGGLHPGVPCLPASQAAARPPMDYVYLVDGGCIGSHEDWNQCIGKAAEFLMLDGCSALGKQLDCERAATIELAQKERDQDWTPWLRTCSTAELRLHLRKAPQDVAKQVAHELLCDWSEKIQNDQNPDRYYEDSDENLKQIKQSIQQLFLDEGWTAELWTESLLRMIPHMPAGTTQAASIANDANDAIEQDKEKQPDFSELTEPAQMSIALITQQVETVFATTICSIRRWMERECCAKREKWGLLTFALGQLSNEFAIQAAELQNTASRLEASCLALEMKSSPANPSKVVNAKFFAKIHEVGASSLARLSNYLLEIRSLWSIEADSVLRGIQREIDRTDDRDAHRQTNHFDCELAILNQTLRNLVEPQLDEFVSERIKSHLYSLWNWNADSLKAPNLQPLSSGASQTMSPVRRLSFEQFTPHCIDLVRRISIERGWFKETETERNDQPSLTQQIREAQPRLLRLGGARRDILAVPPDFAKSNVHVLWRQLTSESVSLIEASELQNPLFLSDGERLSISQIANSICISSDRSMQLTNRLLSRNDIDCQPL
jgi:serine/threonine protein kinase